VPAQLKLPVKVVVFNNGALGFIELEQKSTGFLNFGTEFANPNFAAMAEAIGIRGVRLTSSADVDSAIGDALAYDGPVLIDAMVTRTELVMPPSITVEMAKGFSLYMVKAIMSSKRDQQTPPLIEAPFVADVFACRRLAISLRREVCFIHELRFRYRRWSNRKSIRHHVRILRTAILLISALH
jgi:hypothetical protein